LVKDCLDGGWLDDIPADLDTPAIEQLLAVADHMERLTVTTGVADVFKWNWDAKETYSASSYYLGMFHGEHRHGWCSASLEVQSPGQMSILPLACTA
jgi:hypothetical protein